MAEKGNFWEFVDPFLGSRKELENFCKNYGFILQDRIGAGGFGSVYKIEDIISGERFALKLLDFTPQRANIIPKIIKKENAVFCDVNVKITRSIKKILQDTIVLCSIEEIIPFLIESKWDDHEGVSWEKIRYPLLVREIFKDDLWSLTSFLEDSFIPGEAELFLYEVLDSDKWHSLSLWEIGQLAPALFQDLYYDIAKECWIQCGELLCPALFPVSFDELHTLNNTDIVNSFIHEFISELSWFESVSCELLPTAFDKMNTEIRQTHFSLWKLLCSYSWNELLIRFPFLWNLQITQNMPGGIAISCLSGDDLLEVKRLLAVKQEICTANALFAKKYAGFNRIHAGTFKIGNNVALLSPFLFDANQVFEEKYVTLLSTVEQGEEETYSCIKFPLVLKFLYQMGNILVDSDWNFGDIKWGNFKIDFDGSWKVIDFGGHGLRLFDNDRESIVGSNDYSCESLFYLLNGGVAESAITERAINISAQWFSLIKVAVRMISGKLADTLRGTDLNRALLSNFRGYHENVFDSFIENLLNPNSIIFYQKELLDEDVAFLFESNNNLGLEVAFRRFLFIIGLCLTKYCVCDLLDKEMKQKLVVSYGNNDDSLQLLQEDDKISLVESVHNDEDLSPILILSLMQKFFPGLESWYKNELQAIDQRHKILELLQCLGIVHNIQDFGKLSDFCNNVHKYLEKLPDFAWNNEENKIRCLNSTNMDELINCIQELATFRIQAFNRMIHSEATELDIVHAEVFFLARWFQVHTAYEKNNALLLEWIIQSKWCTEINKESIEKLYQYSCLCSSPIRCSILLAQESARMQMNAIENQYKEEWEKLLSIVLDEINAHPFATAIDINKSALDIYKEMQLIGFPVFSSCEQQAKMERLCIVCNSMPWAECAIKKELLNILQEATKNYLEKINSFLSSCELPTIQLCTSWAECEKNLNNWLNTISIIPEVTERLCNIPENTGDKLSFVYELSEHLLQNYQHYIHHIYCCVFLADIDYVDNILESTYKKLDKLCKKIVYNAPLLMWLEKIREQDKKISRLLLCQNYLRIFWLNNNIDALESCIEQWLLYWNDNATVSTMRRIKHVLASSEGAQLFSEQNSCNVDNIWKRNCLYTRIIHFLVKTYNKQIVLTTELRDAFNILISSIYKNGLLLSNVLLQNNELAIQIYQELQETTNQFKNIPKMLEDLKNLAYENMKNLTAEQVTNCFLDFIPKEVTSPEFRGSLLFNFLDYQIDISQQQTEHNVRRKILLMQLENEFTEFTKEYDKVTALFPQYCITLQNLALLSKHANIEALCEHAKNVWTERLNIFHEYLVIEEWILKQEQASWAWNWRELYNQNSIILSTAYPELNNEQYREIYLACFDLKPLPSLSEIKDLVQKCKTLRMSEQQRSILLQILCNQIETTEEIWDKAKQFVHSSCFSDTEEQISQLFHQLSIQDSLVDEYWQARKQLSFSLRTKIEDSFLEKLKVAKTDEQKKKIVLLESWKYRFQVEIQSNIVNYFYQEYDKFKDTQQESILQMLENSGASKPITIFQWLFSNYLLEPSLLLLNSISLFESKRSEEIQKKLAIKYPMGEPIEVQYSIVKTIKEQLALKISKSQIFHNILSLIE